MYLLLGARTATSSAPLASGLTFQLYMSEYLFKRNVLTIGSEDGDKLAVPYLQADFSVIFAEIFLYIEQSVVVKFRTSSTPLISRLTFQLYVTDYLCGLYLLFVARMATSSPPMASRLTFQFYMTDYLFKRNVLTVGSKNGDEFAAPGLQADRVEEAAAAPGVGEVP